MRLKTLFCIMAISTLSVACASKKKAELQDQKAQVKTEATQSENSYACLVGKDVRLVEVEKTQKGCEVNYTKLGEKQQVAWAESTPSICTRVKKQIRNNIEAKGFKCDQNMANLTKERKTASE